MPIADVADGVLRLLRRSSKSTLPFDLDVVEREPGKPAFFLPSMPGPALRLRRRSWKLYVRRKADESDRRLREPDRARDGPPRNRDASRFR